MALLQKLFTRINGLDYRQEYLCLAKESFQQPLYLYFVKYKRVVRDITSAHNFVGYCPLIFALPSDLAKDFNSEPIKIYFSPAPLLQNEIFREKDAVGSLDLKKISQKTVDESLVSFYEGVYGRHWFLSRFHQSVIRVNNHWYGKKPGNVFLKGNLYNQVQIGYSVPRKICLITVAQNHLYNLFPTDLHGQIGEEYYVISLRHGGNACKQVESAGRIVLSDMNANAYQTVYSLGKNHMQPLKERATFNFSGGNSKNFNLPLPKAVVAYKELEIVSSFIKGIHRLILFRIICREQTVQKKTTLVHIHNCYATWRNKQGFVGNYLMR